MIEALTKPEEFEKFGCVLIREFLDFTTIKTISIYMENKIRRNEWHGKEVDPMTKLAYYGDPLIETVLQESLPLVAETCGKDIYPTYSFMRVYQPREELKSHVDRPSCEISVTVNVASKGNLSPIWMHYRDNQPQSYILNPGDAVVYKGCEAKHWRDPLESDQLNVQFMLHYVNKFGPHSDRKFDTRPALGYPSSSRRS